MKLFIKSILTCIWHLMSVHCGPYSKDATQSSEYFAAHLKLFHLQLESFDFSLKLLEFLTAVAALWLIGLKERVTLLKQPFHKCVTLPLRSEKNIKTIHPCETFPKAQGTEQANSDNWSV